MFSLHTFPRAILHVDGDAFFASCEVASRPELLGSPVVTGAERGIASSLSYKAKEQGVKRGMPLGEVRRICPEAVILPSDYETYSLFSKRMFEIVLRFTSEVEEYSIDECFADLTGMRRPLRLSYPEIALRIKQELQQELGITFSVGLAPNKVLAKVASRWQKPNGFTVIGAREIEKFLRDLPSESIWGIGPNTAAFLAKCGVRKALEFAKKPEEWVRARFTKPLQEIWRELRGEFVYPLSIGEKRNYQSISKTKTFTPPSNEAEFVFAQLSKNIENACIKARRHKLLASEATFFLKTADFNIRAIDVGFSRPTNIPAEIIPLARQQWGLFFQPHLLYRASGAVLSKLTLQNSLQLDLFGEAAHASAASEVYEVVDELHSRFGKHVVFLTSSLKAMQGWEHLGARGMSTRRKTTLFRGETFRRRLGIPFLGEAV